MRSSDLPHEKRTILMTGCSSGIGLHCALALHQKNYRVIATARKEEDVRDLKARGLTAFQLDISSSNSIKLALKQILEHTDHQLFALFNNAGFGQPGSVEDLTREVIREQFETNVFGTLELTNAVLPIMRKQGYGRIIQNSSVLGFICLPFRGAYNASKHALEALTNTMRLELLSTHIFISTISPGPIKSHFRQNAYQMFLKNIPSDKSPYRKIYRYLQMRLQDNISEPPFTLGPEAVEKALLKALNAKRPQAHYYVTFPTYLFGFLKRILSDAMLDKVLLRAGGNEAKLLKSGWTE